MAKKNKISPEKAREMLHNPPHGKPLTDKQRKYFGYLSNAHIGMSLPNYNDSNVSLPPNFVGQGYDKGGRAYNGAWGGTMQIGGSLPGATGFMYARQGAPSNGKYAKKTKASAQMGTNLFPVESWKKQGLTSSDTLSRGTMYRMPFDAQKKLYGTPIPKGSQPNDIGYITTGPGQEDPNILYNRKFATPNTSISESFSGIKKTRHMDGMELQSGGNLFDTKALKARNAKRDSVRSLLLEKYPHDYQKVNNGMLDYFQQEKPINDNKGQYNHPGKVTKIDSNRITMQGVNYPVLGISDTGHQQLMQPGGEYAYNGSSVTEYPIMASGGDVQNQGQLTNLDELTNFTNYNMEKAKDGKWIQKAINPKHKGYCTPMTKSTCTPKRRALAKTFKKHHGFHHAQDGLNLDQYNTQPFNSPSQGGGYQSLNLGQSPKLQGYGNYAPPQLDLSGQSQGSQSFLGGIGDKIGGLQGGLNIAGGLISGFKMLGQEKKQEQQAHQFAELSNVVANAASTRPEKVKRKYTRPEDIAIQPNQMFPSQGVGTNYLANGGEIQNTYAPNTIYTDMGYEPLDDSNKVKQFQVGGDLMAYQAGNIGSSLGSFIQGTGGYPNAGGQIGGTIGETAGNLLLPGIGGIIGKGIGSFAGELLDTKAKKIKKYNQQGQANLQRAALQEGVQNVQTQNSSFMEEGGWVSHNWQPQVITKFGEYSVKDLLKPDPMMNTLRAGGHISDLNYIAPSREALETYALGGELKTHWGGKAETMSHNPYLPDQGETVMFKGQSHAESDGKGNSGIGVTYGNNPVEVERGEPAVKLQDGGTGQDNLVVFGNMTIPPYGVKEIGDKNAKNKKFKNYISDLSELEAKQNKIVSKGTKLVNSTDDNNAFDLLKMNSGKALIEGGNMKLKDIAQKKQTASIVQNAILESAKEHNIDSEALSKGKIKKAKMGGNYAQAGADLDLYGKIKNFFSPEDVDSLISKGYKPLNASKKVLFKDTPSTKEVNSSSGSEDFNKWFGKEYKKNPGGVANYKGKPIRLEIGKPTQSSDREYVGIRNEPNLDIPGPQLAPIPGISGGPNIQSFPPEESFVSRGKGYNPNVLNTIGQLWPYFRSTNQIGLDPNQLAGEMFAISSNQLDPVQAQLYHPQLDQPYDISLQDQLNANQSDFNAIQRQTGYSPAAQASLAAQKYAANSGVLGNQFRANQAEKAQVYSKNRDILNDAQLKNLAILDQQYVRQATAKSNTKAIAQSALSSIADKIQQNKLENRTLGVYENLYNYRYDNQGRAYNLNAPAQFNIPGQGNSNYIPQDNKGNELLPIYDKDGNTTGYKVKDAKKKALNGTIVKALKSF